MPTAFVSYSRDSAEHSTWVERLATRLRGDGIESTLDNWSLAPGESLTLFMESLVRHDFVICVCTRAIRRDSTIGQAASDTRPI
ncbi:toll/interleukin-1 receptor domain-containing protein [Rhizobium leguminosarum]|uniref:toll/interleukin-1 receptor domain-containing protein n=1 Tax=Rhizobium leguminosarum TaxID=384 RepID=UPI001441F64A|nr:TIR domain-containing protein [Rhizobium leguminosarum bv. viciae]